ncbi:MAG: cytochrome c [Alphaproteobacteria bacterium]|nr:cytochrome c [Alphaproteobacteria bacterium]
MNPAVKIFAVLALAGGVALGINVVRSSEDARPATEATAEQPAAPAEADAGADLVATGEALFVNNGCAACHGESGIPLVNVAFYTDEDILGVMASPPAGMPVFDLTDEEKAAIIAYLRTVYPSS